MMINMSFGPFVLRNLKTYGFWSMAHEIRTDFAMFLGSLFLLIKGEEPTQQTLRLLRNNPGLKRLNLNSRKALYLFSHYLVNHIIVPTFATDNKY